MLKPEGGVKLIIFNLLNIDFSIDWQYLSSS